MVSINKNMRNTFVIIALLILGMGFSVLFATSDVYAETDDVEINEDNFPDENFRQYVISHYDQNNNTGCN